MQIYFSLLAALIGGVLFFAFKNNGDVKALAKDLWFAGWLAFLLTGAQHIGVIGR